MGRSLAASRETGGKEDFFLLYIFLKGGKETGSLSPIFIYVHIYIYLDLSRVEEEPARQPPQSFAFQMFPAYLSRHPSFPCRTRPSQLRQLSPLVQQLLISAAVAATTYTACWG
jgi:hypothetical protein